MTDKGIASIVKTADPAAAVTAGRCRHCGTALRHTFVDLGMSPLCESFLREDQLNSMEAFYPLRVFVCESCFLVQLQEYVSPESIFSEYAYFSSYAQSWLDHARRYTDQMIERWALNAGSQVIELASNDGYLLQYFVQRQIPALGIEPAANVAATAVAKGVPTLVRFFGRQTAAELVERGMKADLLVGNNVLAQVPDIGDFVAGMKIVLKDGGVITMEFPHLLTLIEQNQFDTIYHEHFSYFSLLAAINIFEAHGLIIFDVDELPTHGGSLRIFARHREDESKPVGPRVTALLNREIQEGLSRIERYSTFGKNVERTKRLLLEFLIDARNSGRTVVGYGAPGKGNTLLNYCGIRTDFLDYTVDRNPFKHGKFTPGTHIPIYPPDHIDQTRPDFVLILPWNLKDEIKAQMAHIREWGGRFVVPIPEVSVE
jgi:C-methyltransferase-like protein/putative zinc binding protein/methyltransferase family protein